MNDALPQRGHVVWRQAAEFHPVHRRSAPRPRLGLCRKSRYPWRGIGSTARCHRCGSAVTAAPFGAAAAHSRQARTNPVPAARKTTGHPRLRRSPGGGHSTAGPGSSVFRWWYANRAVRDCCGRSRAFDERVHDRLRPRGRSGFDSRRQIGAGGYGVRPAPDRPLIGQCESQALVSIKHRPDSHLNGHHLPAHVILARARVGKITVKKHSGRFSSLQRPLARARIGTIEPSARKGGNPTITTSEWLPVAKGEKGAALLIKSLTLRPSHSLCSSRHQSPLEIHVFPTDAQGLLFPGLFFPVISD